MMVGYVAGASVQGIELDKRTSPNYFNITRPIALNAKLEIV